METNTELINRLHARLKELTTIAQKEEFDKAVVIQRIKTINNDLTEINSIREEILQEHKKRETELYQKFDLQHSTINSLNRDLKAYIADVDAEVKAIAKRRKRKPGKPSIFLSMSDEKIQEIKTAITIDKNEINAVLNNYNYRKLSAKRKRWVWWTNLFFHSNYWTHQIIKLLLGTAIGYGLEKLATLIFQSPDYLITVIVALLLFATGDRIIDKKYDRIFWNRIRKHSINLYKHFDLYLTHMQSLLEDKNQQSNFVSNPANPFIR